MDKKYGQQFFFFDLFHSVFDSILLIVQPTDIRRESKGEGAPPPPLQIIQCFDYSYLSKNTYILVFFIIICSSNNLTTYILLSNLF